jgi:tetratricopeptide (TPR) repeat protein
MRKTIVFGFTIFILVTGATFAQTQRPWWYTLERGKILFRDGAYGNALMTFEDARRERAAYYTRLEQDLITLLSLPYVRLMEDSLEFVERYIVENHENRAAEALAELYYRVPKDTLKGSVTQALAELDRLKSYPEADFWVAETLRVEGELSLALLQYERAWDNRALFEVPGFTVDILYRIADVQRIRRNYPEMERWALQIIEAPQPYGDSLWSGTTESDMRAAMALRAAMMRILENDGIDRFLTLYRHRNTDVESAHRLLGFFYYATGRYPLATEHLLFAFLIQNSLLIDEIIRRDYDFDFTTLENLLERVRARPELLAFIEDTEYYRTIYYLSSALYATGKTRPASQLWTFLSRSNAAGEWGSRARRSPTPYIEPVVEMP